MNKYQAKSFVYYGPGKVERETVELTCGPSDIILKVDVCGRCGTDRRLFEKSHALVKPPTILGHELVARVVEVGDEVKTLTSGIGYKDGRTLGQEELHFPQGQRVTLQSKNSRYNNGLMLVKDRIQLLSFQIPGGFTQYMKVSADTIRSGGILPIPDNVADEEAVMVEPAACALESIFTIPHALGVDREGRHIVHSGIKPGGRTLIVGSGPLAMMYGQLAKIEGAGEVWFIVRSQQKAGLCIRVLGDWPRIKIFPDYSHLPLPEKLKLENELAAEFRDLTRGELFDDVILAAPSKDAQRYMFQLLNPAGYGVAVLFAGLQEASDYANVDLLHYRMAKAVGSSGCSTRTMQTVLDWLASGKLSLQGYSCARHYTLDDDPGEFLTTKADGLKPLLYPWE